MAQGKKKRPLGGALNILTDPVLLHGDHHGWIRVFSRRETHSLNIAIHIYLGRSDGVAFATFRDLQRILVGVAFDLDIILMYGRNYLKEGFFLE